MGNVDVIVVMTNVVNNNGIGNLTDCIGKNDKIVPEIFTIL